MASNGDVEDFQEIYTRDRHDLFERHRKEVSRSLRRWERQQLLEKTRERALRLAALQSANQERLTALHQGASAYNLKSIRQAAVHNDTTRLKELLDSGFDPNSASAMGLTPLFGACQSGSLDAVRLLLTRGANVDLQHIRSQRTALMEACARDNPDVVKELLRHGAKLDIRDGNGETAFDCATDPTAKQYLEAASAVWSLTNARFFPTEFRAASITLFLISHRQAELDKVRYATLRREAMQLVPIFKRSAAAARVKFDELISHSSTQVTLLKRIESQRRAEDQFERDRVELIEALEKLLRNLADAQQARALPSHVITNVLSFCSRHWFDAKSKLAPNNRVKRKHLQHSILPSTVQQSLTALPVEMSTKWQLIDAALHQQCDELQRILADESSDANAGVSRSKHDGHSLARLRVTVNEAKDLPWRDARVLEPIDPMVHVKLLDQQNETEAQSTSVRVATRDPCWNEEFVFVVETTKCDVWFQVLDATRKQSAGEATIPLRSLLDQREREVWLSLPPTLRQQALQQDLRHHSARLRVTVMLVHAQSILVTREIQALLAKRNELMKEQRVWVQDVLDRCIQKLGT